MLKIDLDYKPPEEWLEDWKQSREQMLYVLGYDVEYTKTFDTKRGMHVYILLKQNVDAETGNRLQFLCGDDHTRVKINAWRIKRGIKRWNKLFHKVLYRKKAKVLTCFYCGNKIPVPDRWFKDAMETAN